jgi:nucleotide-binding universal stress UspA family protein
VFKHLLVPLDGSLLAEAALPAAAYLARTLGASVTPIHIIERGAPQEIHGERHLTDPDEACAYLDEVAAHAFPPEVKVESHVHTAEVSDVARSIVAHVGDLGPDLIVMCTHGSGGLRAWLFGSIAQQVIALGTTPVLLIQPQRGGTAPQFTCRRLLVPVDGDPDHAAGLVVASGLAQACAAELHLIVVVHTPSTLSGRQAATARLLPAATSVLLDIAQQGSEEYLRGLMARARAAGLSVTAEVRRGDPAKIIVRTARRTQADLIVLGTHGKSGMDAFWSGSVAAQVSSRSHLPLLLVPVREPATGKPGFVLEADLA